MPNPAAKTGKVYLVGAGPGDPGLITLKGAACLAKADLVLYDYLVNAQILDHAPTTAELVCLGRHGRGRILPPDEVIARMVAAARAGKVVVRLKSGEPMIFGRAAEELKALQDAGIAFEVVPGISAAIAASAYAGIPLTTRSDASAVAFVTAQQSDEKPARSLDYNALARFPGTLVFYMGVTTAAEWTRALVDAGRSPQTPAAIVRRCSWPDQLVVRCTLGEVADVVALRHIRPPAIVVVGEVAATHSAVDWFAARPLVGKRILVTRSLEQAAPLRAELEELGAMVLVQAAIRIEAPADWAPIDRAIDRLGHYDWLVFSSVNGVDYFVGRLLELGHDIRDLGHARLAAIGPATAEALGRHGLRAVQPNEYRAEALADLLAADAAGRRILLLRASRGREVLAERLRAAGAEVDQIVVYQSIDSDKADPEIVAALAAGQIDYVTVSSSAVARSLHKLFGDLLDRAKLVSISPVTSATLRELGCEPALEAARYTTDGLISAILTDVGTQAT
jgi:uroporphyrinogen III methyltransferase/synthase